MTTQTDPKARVVEMVSDRDKANLQYLLEGGAPEPETVQEFADRMDSEGLLASAPVVPSAQELAEVLIEAKRIEEGFEKVAEIPKLPPEHPQMKRAQAIRNHLLTLGWREK